VLARIGILTSLARQNTFSFPSSSSVKSTPSFLAGRDLKAYRPLAKSVGWGRTQSSARATDGRKTASPNPCEQPVVDRRNRRTGEAETGSGPCGQSHECVVHGRSPPLQRKV